MIPKKNQVTNKEQAPPTAHSTRNHQYQGINSTGQFNECYNDGDDCKKFHSGFIHLGLDNDKNTNVAAGRTDKEKRR